VIKFASDLQQVCGFLRVLRLTVDSGCIDLSLFQEEFEVVIRIRKSKKDRQDNGKRKVQTMIYKTLHIPKSPGISTPVIIINCYINTYYNMLVGIP
jgi:hypothetical protein